MFTGLSLDQAPPFEAPLRFFLTAPIFGVIGAIFIFFAPDLNFYAPSTVAILHLFTLGFMSMVMIGAMQQMLPVLVGVRFPKPLLFAKLIHISLIIGTLLLAFGLFFDKTKLLFPASIFLFFSIGLFVLITIYKLFSASFGSATVWAMRFSLIALFIALLLGVHMLISLGLSKASENFNTFLSIHAIWAFFGWVGLLIVGVSYQVIPMFYVTPDFKKWAKRELLILIFLSLFLSLSFFANFKWTLIFTLLLFSIFGFLSFKLLRNRKRKLADITINYWRISSISLITGSILLFITFLIDSDNLLWISGSLLGYGFAISLINGMLYKITPFLAWFHLSSKGFFDIPTMKEMIKEKDAKNQLIFHILALISLLFLPFLPTQKLLAVFIAISNILLLINLLKAAKIFFEYKNKPSPIESFSIKKD